MHISSGIKQNLHGWLRISQNYLIITTNLTPSFWDRKAIFNDNKTYSYNSESRETSAAYFNIMLTYWSSLITKAKVGVIANQVGIHKTATAFL